MIGQLKQYNVQFPSEELDTGYTTHSVVAENPTDAVMKAYDDYLEDGDEDYPLIHLLPMMCVSEMVDVTKKVAVPKYEVTVRVKVASADNESAIEAALKLIEAGDTETIANCVSVERVE